MSFKTVYLLLCIHFFLITCAHNTILLTLQYPCKAVSKNWSRSDFDKITAFKNAYDDIGSNASSFTFNVDKDTSHINHDYLESLVRGNCSPSGIKRYIQDYNYFIANDILLDQEGKHKPWTKSLKWQIFQEHKKFFYGNIHCNPFVKEFLYNKFLSHENENGIIKKTVQIGLDGFTDGALELSISYPYLIHYQHIFEKNERIMSLEFNNCIIENLELKTLFEYFPNLHALVMKNCYIQTITSDDYSALLTRLRPKEDQEVLRVIGINENLTQREWNIVHATVTDRDTLRQNFAINHNRFSCIINLEGSHIVNVTHMIQSKCNSKGNKPIIITGIPLGKLPYQFIYNNAKYIITGVLSSLFSVFFALSIIILPSYNNTNLEKALFLSSFLSGIFLRVILMIHKQLARKEKIVIE